MHGAKKNAPPPVYPPFTSHSGKTSVTKCACGMPEDDTVEMVMCTNRKCYTWQHSQCVGFQGEDDLSNYECPLCSRGEKWTEDDDKNLMEEFELEIGKKEPRDRIDFFKEFLERYEIDKTTGFLDRRFRKLSKDFLLDESVDINRKAAVCIRGRIKIPEELKETLESCGKLKSDRNGGYKYTSKDKKVRIVSVPRRKVTVKPEESEEDPVAASLLAPNAPFSPAEDPAALPNDASPPHSPGLQDVPEYDAPQQDFDSPQDLSQNKAETSDVAPQDTRTPSPGVHERLLVKIRPSDFPSLFPAHLLAAPVPAAPSPTPSEDRQAESPTPPALAQDTRTSAPLPLNAAPPATSPLNAAPPSTSTKTPGTSTTAPPVTFAPIPTSSTSHVPNGNPLSQFIPQTPSIVSDAPMDFENPLPPSALAPIPPSSTSPLQNDAPRNSANPPPPPELAPVLSSSTTLPQNDTSMNPGNSAPPPAADQRSEPSSELYLAQTGQSGLLDQNQYAPHQQMPRGPPNSRSRPDSSGSPLAHPNQMGSFQIHGSYHVPNTQLHSANYVAYSNYGTGHPGPSHQLLHQYGPLGVMPMPQPPAYYGAGSSSQPGHPGPSHQPVPLGVPGPSSWPGFSGPPGTLYPAHFQGHFMPINNMPRPPYVDMPVPNHPSWFANPFDPRNSGMPLVNPNGSSKKRKHGASSTILAVPDTSAYNMLYAVNSLLESLCDEESGLESLAEEFENTLKMREKVLKEKKVSYNIFFDNLEYVFNRLKDKSRSVKTEDGEDLEIAEICLEIDAKLFWDAFWELLNENRKYWKEFQPLCDKVKELSEGSGENVIRVEDIVNSLRTPFLIYLM
ncbi:hypothetical protein CRE_12038 [Caenorhabditis remanei]|uniref:Zinc finger PHD-type domain-containing protein n=1 Tax=Caenorhabditis remanei TaxID=31234 RepID=E3MPW7_CAERE|nr:hypothetical protein CRE_12038 [Caenorhabditis remanei]